MKRKQQVIGITTTKQGQLKPCTTLATMFLAFVLFFGSQNITWASEGDYSGDDYLALAQSAISWKRQAMHVGNNDPFFAPRPAAENTSPGTDWLALALGRLGYSDAYEFYITSLEANVQNTYADATGLSLANPTDWHRSGIVALSLGGSPTSFTEQNINLVASGTYSREGLQPLSVQGTSAYIWGLLLLDSLHYKIPDDAVLSRDTLLSSLLAQQETDGGFGFGNGSSADLTGMALQALAPYYNSEQAYQYTRVSDSAPMEGTVRNAVDTALIFLSESQQSFGGFGQSEDANCESIAQVIIALCTLGIDPGHDPRFVKDGNTLIDALLTYEQDDGGYAHELETQLEEGVSSSPIATDQCLLAFAALLRQEEGVRNLYDFRAEQDDALKIQIAHLERALFDLDTNASSPLDPGHVQTLFNDYLAIPANERSYVCNYSVLANALSELGIENSSESLAAAMNENTDGTGSILDLFDPASAKGPTLFSVRDAQSAQSLPTPLTTEQSLRVRNLLDKLQYSENRAEYSSVEEGLTTHLKEIEVIETEISAISAEILNTLYPASSITSNDKEKVAEVAERIEALSPYDRSKVLEGEAILLIHTTQNYPSSNTWIFVTISVAVLAIVSAVIVIRVRGKKKQ